MSKEAPITRRRFLKGVAAAAAAPYLVGRAAWGQVAPPSDRITVGCIGVGGMGSGHLGGLLARGQVQVVAVCDVDTERREAARNAVDQRYASDRGSGTYRGCAAYNDFRELLARDDIDAVLIATPDHWHALIAIAAAAAGKDIYCEKPLSLTIAEGRAMVNAVRRYGRVFQTGSQQRSDGNFRLACELVRSGRIGKVQTVHVAVGGPSGECHLPAEPVPPGLDWDLWLGPAPWRPFNRLLHPANWRAYRDYSGGGMTDWGAHHFDIAQWGLGMDESGPVEVLPPDGKERPLLTYRYANGVRMYHGGGPEVFANREGNGILFTGTEGKVEVNRSFFRTWPEAIAREPLGPDDVHLYRTRGHNVDDWLECIRTRRRPVCDVEIGHRSVTVCHLGNLAYWLNRPIRWDPKREQVVGDPEANRWVDRPMRAPWCLT